jgi:hypothetical protein
MFTFRADCSACCGLCCVVPDQLTVQGFRRDKRANVPCRYLNSLHRCSIHATRRLDGYSPCESFDCFGVGQWITQRLFNGNHWTDSPAIAREMFAAYRLWAPRFEAAALIEAALPYVRADARESLVTRMLALTAVDTPAATIPSDRNRLYRETIALIRAGIAGA